MLFGKQIDCYLDADFAGLWMRDSKQGPIACKAKPAV